MSYTKMDISLTQRYMARAIQLASCGRLTTQPNPCVGCVLVKDGQIIAEGFHRCAGQPHAEINALNQAGKNAVGATVYVSLEPCCHYGLTPPCTDALVKAGVKHVVAAMVDPNPEVAGKGLERLRQAGITTEHGVLEQQAIELNLGFIKRMTTGLPYVRLKLASSLDGRTAMASGESKWITSEAARQDVQKLRARSSAIITGVNSIIQDDSALTVRAEQLIHPWAHEIANRQPLRVVLDSKLRLPLDAKILQQPGRTLVVSCCTNTVLKSKLEAAGAKVISLPMEQGRVALKPLLAWLARNESCNDLMIEAGATLAGAFLQQRLVDEIHLYMATTLLGSDARSAFELPILNMAQQIRLNTLDMRLLDNDLCWVLQPDNRD